APSSDTCRLLARHHAARCRVLSRTDIFGYRRSLRPCIAWCWRPRNSAASLEGALMAGIRFERVTKRFDDGTIAVDELDLGIEDGEFVVIVGPSGSGKSTALRAVAGLEQPTAGRIWLGDEDVTDVPPQDRDVAMVFQNYALYPHMTVEENLGFALKLHRV